MTAHAPRGGDRVLQALRHVGGEATITELGQKMEVHNGTVRRYLQPLLDQHLVEEVRRSRYRLAGEPAVRSEAAKELLSFLEERGYEAHLTGFDLLAPHAHQFVYDFPHLVYGEPSATAALAYELPAHGFVVAFASPGPKPTSPAASRLVFLRNQTNAEQYGVRGHLASVEKAWVDTLRESRRGNLEVSYLELGRILRSVVDGGADLRYLRRYARQLGYIRHVDDALAVTQSASAEGRAMHAGYNG